MFARLTSLVVLALLTLTEGGSLQNYGEVEVVRLNDPQIVAEIPWVENGSSASINPESSYRPRRATEGKNSMSLLQAQIPAEVTDATLVYKNAKKKVVKLESALTSQQAKILRGKQRAIKEHAEMFELEEKVAIATKAMKLPAPRVPLEKEDLKHRQHMLRDIHKKEAAVYEALLQEANAESAKVKAELHAERDAREARIVRVKERLKKRLQGEHDKLAVQTSKLQNLAVVQRMEFVHVSTPDLNGEADDEQAEDEAGHVVSGDVMKALVGNRPHTVVSHPNVTARHDPHKMQPVTVNAVTTVPPVVEHDSTAVVNEEQKKQPVSVIALTTVSPVVEQDDEQTAPKDTTSVNDPLNDWVPKSINDPVDATVIQLARKQKIMESSEWLPAPDEMQLIESPQRNSRAALRARIEANKKRVLEVKEKKRDAKTQLLQATIQKATDLLHSTSAAAANHEEKAVKKAASHGKEELKRLKRATNHNEKTVKKAADHEKQAVKKAVSKLKKYINKKKNDMKADMAAMKGDMKEKMSIKVKKVEDDAHKKLVDAKSAAKSLEDAAQQKLVEVKSAAKLAEDTAQQNMIEVKSAAQSASMRVKELQDKDRVASEKMDAKMKQLKEKHSKQLADLKEKMKSQSAKDKHAVKLLQSKQEKEKRALKVTFTNKMKTLKANMTAKLAAIAKAAKAKAMQRELKAQTLVSTQNAAIHEAVSQAQKKEYKKLTAESVKKIDEVKVAARARVSKSLAKANKAAEIKVKGVQREDAKKSKELLREKLHQQESMAMKHSEREKKLMNKEIRDAKSAAKAEVAQVKQADNAHLLAQKKAAAKKLGAEKAKMTQLNKLVVEKVRVKDEKEHESELKEARETEAQKLAMAKSKVAKKVEAVKRKENRKVSKLSEKVNNLEVLESKTGIDADIDRSMKQLELMKAEMSEDDADSISEDQDAEDEEMLAEAGIVLLQVPADASKQVAGQWPPTNGWTKGKLDVAESDRSRDEHASWPSENRGPEYQFKGSGQYDGGASMRRWLESKGLKVPAGMKKSHLDHDMEQKFQTKGIKDKPDVPGVWPPSDGWVQGRSTGSLVPEDMIASRPSATERIQPGQWPPTKGWTRGAIAVEGSERTRDDNPSWPSVNRAPGYAFKGSGKYDGGASMRKWLESKGLKVPIGMKKAHLKYDFSSFTKGKVSDKEAQSKGDVPGAWPPTDAWATPSAP